MQGSCFGTDGFESDIRSELTLSGHQAYTDSATIAQYLEYFFPSEPPLALEDEELEAKIKAATGGVFAAFAK